MTRKFTKMMAAIALLTFLAVPLGMWGQTTYELQLVTSVQAGEKYVFERDNRVFINTTSSNALQTTNTYQSTGLTGTEAYVWTLETTATSGQYKMRNVSLQSNYYLNNTSGKTNVSFGNPADAEWKFTFSNNVALIQNATNSNRYLGDNGNSAYKAYSTSNMDYPHDIVVYKLVEEGPVVPQPYINVVPRAGEEDPQILAYPYTIESEYVSFGGYLRAIEFGNFTITDASAFQTVFCDANGQTVDGNPYEDILTSSTGEVDYYELTGEYRLDVGVKVNNNPQDRYAYFKIWANNNNNPVYSGLVTVHQAGKPQVATPTFNPAAGAVPAGTEVAISCTTQGAAIHYTTDGSTPTTSSTTYTEAITVNADMTIKAIAVKDGYINSEMSTAAYTILTVTNIATARAAAVDQTVSTMGIVTYNSSNSTLYIQDETAAIRIYGENLNYSTGTQIAVSGTIAMHNETKQIINPTISVLSTGNDLPYMVKSIEDINTDNYTNFQNLRVQIVEATVISKTGSGNNTNTTIKQGENSLLVYGSMSGVSVNDVITLKGFVYLYNSSTLEITNPTDVVVKPTLTAADMNMNWNETSKTRVVTVNHPVSGSELIAATEAEWLSLSVSENNVTVTTTVNTGAERSATILLDYIKEGETLADSSFTVTQAGKPTMCTVSFNINGVVAMTAEVPTGTALDLSNFTAPVTSDTYSFAGWSASASEISVISTYTPVSGVTEATLYAVYSEGAGGEYQLVTNVDDLAVGNSIVIAAAEYDKAVSKTQDSNNRPSASITKSNNTITLTDNVCEFELRSGSNNYQGTWAFYDNNNNGYLYAAGTSKAYLKTTSTLDANSSWSITITNNVATISENGSNAYKHMRYRNSDGMDVFACYNSTTSHNDLCLYKKVVTRVVSLDESAPKPTPTIVNIPNTIVVTVKSGFAVSLTGTNNGYPASLIIEDGGQLITSNAVAATVQKTIVAHGETTANGGWNFIASPIDGTVDPALAGLITDNEGYQATATTATYDLYRFVQNPVLEEGEGYEWKNYRKNNFLLSNGAGYLYASKNGVTLNFVGNVVPNTADGLAVPLVYAEESATTDMTLRGWNLVGNPFTFDAAVDMAYYTLDANGTVIPNTTTQAIVPPCTGIMVYVNAEGQSITFSKPEESAPSNANLNIAVVQANERGISTSTVDKAIVSFNEGSELPKFYFGNPNASLYIPQGNKEYAIATSDGQGEMPLNFRANADGQYTLTVNPEGVEMNYLHLIDNMTGNDIDLLQTPSYTFNATTRDYESRFRLVFAANNESSVSASSTTFAFYSNGNWMVNNEGEATLQVIDVMGRVLSNQTISGTAELSLNQQPGVYVLRLVNGNDVKTQKIVVR